MESYYTSVVSSGFGHTAAIAKAGVDTALYIWGDNSHETLYDGSKGKLKISLPLKLTLSCGGGQETTYYPFDVACGPSYTMVVGQQRNEDCIINLDDLDRYIMKQVRNLLFQNHKEPKENEDDADDGEAENLLKARIFEIFNFSDKNQNMNPDESEDNIQIMNKDKDSQKDSFQEFIDKDKFVKKILDLKIINITKAKVDNLADLIINARQDNQKADQKISLGAIEDFALGFRQNNVKVFLFGYCHEDLQKAFESKMMKKEDNKENKKKKVDQNDEGQDQKMSVQKPAVIQFPKFTEPIISVSCGSDHALALTVEHEMFSWGSGSYGALGFGKSESVTSPKKLKIYDYKGNVFKIVQIACGKFHSICLTSRQSAFSWGKGLNGQLGLGENNEEDKRAPQEIKFLTQRKPIFIAAGENHSAAISEKNQLYTWGNGGFGRLGHDSDMKECKPRIVEAFEEKDENGKVIEEKRVKIMYVSCGAFHTLCTSDKGQVFSFGQNKYGKLGIHRQKAKEGQAYRTPVKIAMYKPSGSNVRGEEVVKTNSHILKVFAGYNHSIALSNKGKLSTWGYKGKGLLGRTDGGNGDRISVPDLALALTQPEQGFKTEHRDVQDKFYDKRSLELQLIFKKEEKDKKNFFIDQIVCGHQSTICLSNQGDVLVQGTNNYSQHCVEELKRKNNNDKNGQEDFKAFSDVTLIKFDLKSQEKITYIACGAEHIFAKTQLDEVYGWGRNDEGQLGLGYLTEKIGQPKQIDMLSFKNIKQIECGDNYSAGLTIYGEVYVAGSLEGGKLGLGKGQRKGYQLDFKRIEKLPDIDKISCGVDHMLAISRQPGKYYAWGKNQRGQLGISSKGTNVYEPKEIQTNENKFIKFACGNNFSLGLTSNGKVYHWGNYKYNGSKEMKSDIEEPLPISKFENHSSQIVDIACSYKYCIAIDEKGEMQQWGKYLMKKSETDDTGKDGGKKQKDEETEPKSYDILKFPTHQKNMIIRYLSTGPNHTVGVNNGGTIWSWGYNNTNNRLGFSKVSQNKTSQIEIQQNFHVNSFIEMQNQAAENIHVNDDDDKQEVGSDQDEEEKTDDEEVIMLADIDPGLQNNQGQQELTVANIERDQTINQSKSVENKSRIDASASRITKKEDISMKKTVKSEKQAVQKQTNAINSEKDKTIEIIMQIGKHNKRVKNKDKEIKAVIRKLCVFDQNVDLYCLEFIRQELQVRMKPVPRNITIQQNNQKCTSIQEMNRNLQKILLEEPREHHDEMTISDLDINLKALVHKLMKQVLQFTKFQRLNHENTRKGQTNFLSRISEKPFRIDPSKSFTISMRREEMLDKVERKIVKEGLRLIQLHPCYMLQILKSPVFQFQHKKMLINQLFSSTTRNGKLRNNYHLISIYNDLLEYELLELGSDQMSIEEVDLCGYKWLAKNKDGPEIERPYLVSSLVFEHIFDSQPTNLDTIACIACHFINSIQSQLQQGSGEQDETFDVNEECKKAGEGGKQKGKKGVQSKGIPIDVKTKRLTSFIELMIGDIINDKVLKDNAQWFSYKKQVNQQLDYIKKAFKSYQQAQKNVIRGEDNGGPQNREEQKDMSGQYLAGLDCEQIRDKFPSLRFSEEVYFMINILYSQLKKMQNYSASNDHMISQIFGLIFRRPLQMVWEKRTTYLYPYIVKPRVLTMIDDGIKIHEINIANAIHAFNAFISGQDFPAKAGQATAPAAIQKLNSSIQDLRDKFSKALLPKIISKGKEVKGLISFVNFENQICHSLEQDDTRVCMSAKLVGLLFDFILENQSTIALQKPEGNDTLIKSIKLPPDSPKNSLEFIKNFKSLPDFKTKCNFKLKTRLFVPNLHDKNLKNINPEANLAQYVRCCDCNATLLQDIAVQNYDENIILPMYEPLDREALVTQYCEIIKGVEEIPKSNSAANKQDADGGEIISPNQLTKELEATNEFAKFLEAQVGPNKSASNNLKAMIQSFRLKLSVEISNIKIDKAKSLAAKMAHSVSEAENIKAITMMNRRDLGVSEAMTEKDKKKLFETLEKESKVLQHILDDAEKKYHERVNQKFKINLIKTHIDFFLQPQLNARMVEFKERLIKSQTEITGNFQYGLANKEVMDWENLEEGLDRLKHFKTQKNNTKVPKSFKNLDAKQVKNIRGYLQVDCKALLKKQSFGNRDNVSTISRVNLKELQELIPACNVVLIESEDGESIEFKLVYQMTKFNICKGNTVLDEHILLQFDISLSKIKDIRHSISVNKHNEDAKVAGVEAQELTFEENDALTFNPELFLKLINQMEKVKANMKQSDGNAPQGQEGDANK